MPPRLAEQEPLLPSQGGGSGRAAFAGLLDSRGPARPRPRRSRLSEIAIAVALPWLLFFLVECLFLFAYGDMRVLVWVLVSLCALLSLLFVFLGVAARHAMFLVLGFLCLAAVVVSCSVGLFIDGRFLCRFRELERGSEYTGVSPLRSARATHDAGVLHFVNGTFVDDRRTLGYVSSGRIFCVAPVGLEGEYARTVEYWAVGVDCCEKRTNFDCGSARDLQAVTAVVEPQSSASEAHARAIAQAESVYNLTSSEHAQMTHFTSRPSEVSDGFWDQAMNTAMLAGMSHLVFSAVAGVAILRLSPPVAKSV